MAGSKSVKGATTTDKVRMNRKRLVAVTSSVVDTITSPQFVDRMRLARKEAEAGRGVEALGALLSIETLRAEGANIPDDFRFTSRTFEDKDSGARVEIGSDSDVGTLQHLKGCGGGGACGICGCGGGYLMN